MKKSKKALLFLTVCLVALVVAVSLVACNNNQHAHTWGNWTVTEENKPTAEATGKATRVCSGEGECDASATDKEYVLPALTSEDYQTAVTTPATCSAQGVTTYIYNKNGVNVSFGVATPIDPAAHKYNYVDLGAQGHKGICEYNADHTTEVAEHDTDGDGGSCSVCGHTVITMGTAVTVSDASSFSPKRYFISLGAGEYELLIDGNAVDTNVAGCVAIIGTLNADYTIASVDTGTNRTVELEAGDYFVEVYVGGTLEVDVWANHQHAFSSVAFSNSPTHHWHTPICIHQDLEPEKCDGYAEHSFSAWSAPNEQGKQTRTCDECGYADTRDLPGTPSNPDELLIGADKVNNAWLGSARNAYFFKLQSATAGKYIIKASVNDADILLYYDLTNVDEGASDNEVMFAESALIVNLTANNPVYIAVKGNNLNPYTITVDLYNEDTDKGLAYGEPAVLTNGSTVSNRTLYYVYTATQDGKVTVTLEKGSNSGNLNIIEYTNASFTFDSYKANGENSYSFNVTNGGTYYIKTTPKDGESVNGTLNIAFATYNSHDYVISLACGAVKFDSATVSLTGSDVTATNNGDGTYTFAQVDSSKDYTLVVSGLGEDYGYYDKEAVIKKNADATTNFALPIYAKQEYKVKIALPDGKELATGETLEGIEVTIKANVANFGKTNDETIWKSDYKVTTDANGIATFMVLDPVLIYDEHKEASVYYVNANIPKTHSLYGKYEYIAPPDGRGGLAYPSFGAESRDMTGNPLVLTELQEYVVFIQNDESEDLPSDVELFINGVKVEGNTICLRADLTKDMISIFADGYIFSNIEIQSKGTQKAITAVFTADSGNSLTIGEPKQFIEAGFEGIAFELTVTESGTYNFVFTNDTETDIGADVWLIIENSNMDSVNGEGEQSCYLSEGTYNVIICANVGTISGYVTVTKAA